MNSPKEKAKELVHKMINIDSDSEIFDGFVMAEFYAQRAALIAVDEILNIDNIKPYILHKEIIKYYQEVKQEIEKI